MVKTPPAKAGDVGDMGSIPGLGRSPGGGPGHPLQHSRLENFVDRAAWWATVHRIAELDTTEALDTQPGHYFLTQAIYSPQCLYLGFHLQITGRWRCRRKKMLRTEFLLIVRAHGQRVMGFNLPQDPTGSCKTCWFLKE